MFPISDEVLIELYEHVAANLSYYNAVEGADHTAKVDARTMARHAYYAARSELVFRKIAIPEGHWIV